MRNAELQSGSARSDVYGHNSAFRRQIVELALIVPPQRDDSSLIRNLSPNLPLREVFVQDFPKGQIRTQVSNQGGVIPLWRHDQSELYYLTPEGGIMAVDVRSSTSGLEFGIPHMLFASNNLRGTNLGGADACDVTPDGERFLCLFPVENDIRDNQLTVLSWRPSPRR